MTIYYNSRDHLKILFAIKGTVWPHSILPCILNSAIYIAVWCLQEYHDIHIAFDKDQISPMAVYAAFVIVTLTDIAYRRFIEAELEMSRFGFLCQSIAVKSMIFSGIDLNIVDSETDVDNRNFGQHHPEKDCPASFSRSKQYRRRSSGSVQCRLWQDQVKVNLIDFVISATEILRDPIIAREYISDVDSPLQRDNQGPYNLLKPLTDSIVQHKMFMREEHAMVIQKEIFIHNEIGMLGETLSNMYTLSATPTPYNLINVIKSTMLVWVIIIPFFQSEYVAFILPAVFLTTYSVIGLDAVACEITDPYGDDLNDLPVAAFMQNVIHRIDHILSEDARRFFVIDPEFDFTPSNYSALLQTKNKTGESSLFDGVRKESSFGTDDANTTDTDSYNYIAQHCDATATTTSIESNVTKIKKSFQTSRLDLDSTTATELSSSPQAALHLETLADAYMQRNVTREAASLYRRALKADELYRKIITTVKQQPLSFQFRVLKKLAHVLFEDEKYAMALQTFDQYFSILSSQAGHNDDDTTTCTYTAEDDYHYDPIRLQHRVGLLHFHQESYETALHHFWTALCMIPDNNNNNNNQSSYREASQLASSSSIEQIVVTVNLQYCLAVAHYELREYHRALYILLEAVTRLRQLQVLEQQQQDNGFQNNDTNNNNNPAGGTSSSPSSWQKRYQTDLLGAALFRLSLIYSKMAPPIFWEEDAKDVLRQIQRLDVCCDGAEAMPHGARMVVAYEMWDDTKRVWNSCSGVKRGVHS